MCLSVILCYRITCLWFCNKRFCNKKEVLFGLDPVYVQNSNIEKDGEMVRPEGTQSVARRPVLEVRRSQHALDPARLCWLPEAFSFIQAAKRKLRSDLSRARMQWDLGICVLILLLRVSEGLRREQKEKKEGQAECTAISSPGRWQCDIPMWCGWWLLRRE